MKEKKDFLVSMKKPKPPTKKGGIARGKLMDAPTPYYEEYPWGLRIDLNTDSLKKLGYDSSKFTVGEKVRIEALAEIKRVSRSEDSTAKETNKIDETVDLQITDMGIIEFVRNPVK